MAAYGCFFLHCWHSWEASLKANGALLQECLEAEFYSYAVYGHGLSDTLLGGGPGSVGGQQATFLLESTRQYATEIANDEINHVADLRTVLGAAACALTDSTPSEIISDIGKLHRNTDDLLAGVH